MDLSLLSDSIASAVRGEATLDAEQDLIERARSDGEAFAQLYRRHYAGIGRYLFARTADRHATEDLLAETFLAAMKGLGRYRFRGAPFHWWLLRIATNAANRWARRDGRMDLRKGVEACVEPIDPDSSATTLEEREECARLHAFVRRLPPRQQSVIVLHYLEDLSIGEISAVLGCREGTVKSQLHRGRAALRALLETR